ncbi:MAG: CHAD domain-containing protein [Elusimicrobia bacterium]|nr:CHAD domain-containing protein [Candidatus Liberimonas magnetica]
MEMKLNVNIPRIADFAENYLNDFLKDYTFLKARNLPATVHAARISTRRLRASLKVLSHCMKNDKHSKYRKYLKKTGKLMGKIRELDVQISFLKTLPLNKALKTSTLSCLKHQRKHAYKAFKKTDSSTNDRIVSELKSCFKALKNSTNCYTGQNIQKLILDYIDKLLSYNTGDYNELHKMRITAKNLRYTLELLKPFNKDIFNNPIISAHKIQDILGDLHEMDVWLNFIKNNKIGKNNSLYTICLSKRQSARKMFMCIWANQRRKRIWEILKKALQKRQHGSY